MSKVYLSGPITGLTYGEARYGWREDFESLLVATDIEVLSPMRHEGHLAEIKGPLDKHYPTHLFSHAKMIVAKDYLDIERSDIVVANFMGATKVSIGTINEMGYARKAGKPIIVIMEDEGNVHDHPFVRENAAVVVNNLEDAATIVTSLLSEGL